MKRTIAHAVAAALLGISALGAAAAAAGPAPHRAVYGLSLLETRESSDIWSVRGRVVVDWQGSACDGYVTSQRIVSRMASKQAADFTSDFRVSSWEAGDGSDFTFILTHLVDGQSVEEIEGRAVRSPGGGEAVFTRPEAASIPLPADVMFPSELVRRMLAAAEAGDRILAGNLFDGSEMAHHFATTVYFGQAGSGAPEAAESQAGGALAGLTYWPVQVSYFDPRDPAGLPSYEVSFRLYDNGVATGLVMDYGDLVLGASLLELEMFPVPDC